VTSLIDSQTQAVVAQWILPLKKYGSSEELVGEWGVCGGVLL
jgi:hypothetical protein